MSDVVLTEPPLWMQLGTYPARIDRALADATLATEGRLWGLAVSQRGAGANLSVDVSGGAAAIIGDDQTFQGKYVAVSRGTTNVPTNPPPTSASQRRIDLLVMSIVDTQAGAAGSTSQGVLRWVMGTATTGTPTAPALPGSAVELARVTLNYGDTSILNAAIDSVTNRLMAVPRNAPIICTSITRPTAPIGGTLIFETDTLTLRCWDGSAFQPIPTDPKAPRGRVPGGYAERRSSAGPQGPEATFGVGFTVTIAASRLIRLECGLRGVNVGSGGTGVLRIKEGTGGVLPGVQLMSCQYPPNAGGGGPGGMFGITVTPGAGPHSYFLSLEGSGQTATAIGGASDPIWLEAIDVGGA